MLFEPYNNKQLFALDNIKNKVFDDFKNGKMHHSLIFVGNKGVGKATLAYHLANKILDSNTTLKNNAPTSLFGDIVNENVLDDNNPTFNLIKNRKHPDLLVIEKEIDSKTSKMDKEIKVSSARKISDFMSLAPFASKYKIIIIDSIDEMNVSAQNAILKSLEEPVKDTFIFLICHNINNVLETILSRCRKINIPNYSFNDWEKIMEYVYKDKFKLLTPDQKNKLYDISNSSISFSVDIIEEDGIFLYEYIETLLSGNNFDVESIQTFADKLNNNEKLYSLFVDFIQLFLYNILKYYTNNEGDETFRKKNYNFILRNNEKSILEKIEFTKNLIRDTDIYNLSKKHALVVLFDKLFNF